MRRLVIAGSVVTILVGPRSGITQAAPARVTEASTREPELRYAPGSLTMAFLASGLIALALVTLLRRRKG